MAWLSNRIREVQSQLVDHGAFIDEEGITINAAAILGLEKYLSPELTAEYGGSIGCHARYARCILY